MKKILALQPFVSYLQSFVSNLLSFVSDLQSFVSINFSFVNVSDTFKVLDTLSENKNARLTQTIALNGHYDLIFKISNDVSAK